MAAAAPCLAHGSSSRCAPPPRPHRRRLAANPGPARRRPPSEPAERAEGQRDELTAPSADPSGPALRNNNSRGASAPPPRRPGSAAAAGAAGGEGRSRGRARRSESCPPRSPAHQAECREVPGVSGKPEPAGLGRRPAWREAGRAFGAGPRPTTEKAFGNVGAPRTRWRWCLG